MITFDQLNRPDVPAILTPEEQRAVWFLGALIRVRAGGSATGGQLAILEHAGQRGYNSPLHLHELGSARPGCCRPLSSRQRRQG